MRSTMTVLIGVASTLALSQSVTSVYNRDTHAPFKLKNVKVESTVVGPIVKTSTWLTYDNPYKTLTEATLNFDLPDAAALGGFAYIYGDEYVRGQLMDKRKAWSIYTAITSRGRDPGIMEQWSPTNYHCQIFPIKIGNDLRVRLWTVGMLQPSGNQMQLPKPKAPTAVGYEAIDTTIVQPNWTVRGVKTGQIVENDGQFSVDLKDPIYAVAQRFKDGRIYVAGIVKAPFGGDGKKHVVEILNARYEPANDEPGGADVTVKVNELVSQGIYSIQANNTTFGDPTPWKLKRLRVKFRVDGVEQTETVAENWHLTFLENSAAGGATSFFKLRQPKTMLLNPNTLAFSGWIPKNETIAVRFQGVRHAIKPTVIAKGSDTARIWAQQMLAKNTWMRVDDVMKFSLKYGVPSNATALLAVPKEEMRLYEEREKQAQRAQAEQRKRELEAQRQGRNWSGKRDQNWNASGGGDPEIRVTIPGARSVDAILPDRRVISLKPDGDTWGGNFEIAADAIEGTYSVRVLAHLKDGSTVERSWTYSVDRTPPTGKAVFVVEQNKLILEVKSESGLAEVAAYWPDGSRLVLKEVQPGVYRAEIPSLFKGSLTVVLKDRAGNKGELTCSRLP